MLQIDMDTIEVSNLNRQFLFRKSHVGQSKAKVCCSPRCDDWCCRFNAAMTWCHILEFSMLHWSREIYLIIRCHLKRFHLNFLSQVAREAVLRFRPGVEIVAHHANVKNQEFDIDFFKQFSVVLNGLDNLEARRHVNRMCLAAGVPLVESGTTGYLGQVRMCSSLLIRNLMQVSCFFSCSHTEWVSNCR